MCAKHTQLFGSEHTKIKWKFIYILEAHTVENWPAGLELEIKQPQNFNERLENINYLNLHENFEIYCDNMNNDFNKLYPSWPYRYWIIVDGIIKVKQIPEDIETNCYFTLNQLKKFLNE